MVSFLQIGANNQKIWAGITLNKKNFILTLANRQSGTKKIKGLACIDGS